MDLREPFGQLQPIVRQVNIQNEEDNQENAGRCTRERVACAAACVLGTATIIAATAWYFLTQPVLPA